VDSPSRIEQDSNAPAMATRLGARAWSNSKVSSACFSSETTGLEQYKNVHNLDPDEADQEDGKRCKKKQAV
jgi:hypothetical protein